MHIYFSGIGGAGLGPLAELAQDANYKVSGSDLMESVFSLSLERRGVDVVYDQTGANITTVHAINPIDWLVYSSALPEDHPELKFARENNIRVTKRDDFLAEFIKERKLKLIAIAGTHGKTTTTSLFVWAAQELGFNISYLVGTTLPFGPSAKFDKKSSYFIYECDEYDRNFLKFSPEISLFPNVDYDHSDIYPTVEDYKEAFRDFIAQSNQNIMFRQTFDYLQPLNTENMIIIDDKVSTEEIKLAGQLRRNNAKLVEVALKEIGDYSQSEIRAALESFPGTNRRFEELSQNIYSDYAHHPTEIAATIQMAREINPKVVVIYQPHQNMRQIEIKDDYKDVFNGAKQVYWLPTYQPSGDREHAKKVLLPEELIGCLSNPSLAEAVQLDDNLWDIILTHQTAGDLVILMSAGNADTWLREKVEESRL